MENLNIYIKQIAEIALSTASLVSAICALMIALIVSYRKMRETLKTAAIVTVKYEMAKALMRRDRNPLEVNMALKKRINMPNEYIHTKESKILVAAAIAKEKNGEILKRAGLKSERKLIALASEVYKQIYLNDAGNQC